MINKAWSFTLPCVWVCVCVFSNIKLSPEKSIRPSGYVFCLCFVRVIISLHCDRYVPLDSGAGDGALSELIRCVWKGGSSHDLLSKHCTELLPVLHRSTNSTSSPNLAINNVNLSCQYVLYLIYELLWITDVAYVIIQMSFFASDIGTSCNSRACSNTVWFI